MRPHQSIAGDLETIFAGLAPDWAQLRGARIFMTGGTGLIGRWMLEALCDANDRLSLGIETHILSRDPAAFAERAPHLANRADVQLVTGDVTHFTAAPGAFTHIIHGATDASAALNAQDPLRMFDTIVTGTRHMLDFARDRSARRFLLMSSGAVYGAQPREISHVTEEDRGAPDCLDPRSAYGEGKRAAEMLCAIYGKQYGLETLSARIFALLGPLLPLETHFAAGNFIRDAMAGQPIHIHGSGQAVRSYLYIADVAAWLWAILLRGTPGAAYNVGSEDGLSIAALAHRIAALLGGGAVEIAGRPDPGWNAGAYVPSTAKIRRDLGVTPTIDLDEAIRRTALWNGWTQ